MLKVEGLGTLLIFMRYKLWAVVCKAAKRDAMAAKWALVRLMTVVDRVSTSSSNS